MMGAVVDGWWSMGGVVAGWGNGGWGGGCVVDMVGGMVDG